MICVAVTPRSRTLAPADLLNAAGRADLVELCLDYFLKDPDVGELIAACPKPLIVSCRRAAGGGHYEGSEDRRLGLLRQAVIAGPAYVELDPDAAAALPRFGETKRLVALHSPDRPLKDIPAAVKHAVETLDADAVKFTWPTPDLNRAWPLLFAVSKDLGAPVVGQGVGAGAAAFNLLALRLGSPWVYAALEEGMEDAAGQPTVADLLDVYDAPRLGAGARFVGLAGFGDESLKATAGAWNAAAKSAGAPHRALPLGVGKFDHLGKMLATLKVPAILFGPGLTDGERAGYAAFAPPADGDRPDAAVHAADGWRSRSFARRAVAEALAKACGGDLNRTQVTLLGAGGGGLGRSLAKRGANLAVADPDDAAAAELAKTLDARAVPWRAVYATRCDAVVRAASAATTKANPAGGPVPLGEGNRAYSPTGLEPSMTVADAAALHADTDFLTAARTRACTVVEPAAIRAAAFAGLLGAVT